MRVQVWKKEFLFIVLLLLSVSYSAQADVTLLESSPSGISLSYTPGQINLDTLYVNNILYTTVTVSGHDVPSDTGHPAVPATSVIFAAPSGVHPTVNVTSGPVRTKNHVRIAPVPQLASDNAGFTQTIYEEDTAAYAMSGYLPESFAVLGGSDNRNGITYWELHLHPALFDAASQSLVMCDSVAIDISFPGGTNFTATGKIPGHVINRDYVMSTSIRKVASTSDNPFDNGDWYKIVVKETGMYQMLVGDLQGAGFPHESVPVDHVHMYYGGGQMLPIEPGDVSTDAFREIAITVNDLDDDGILDPFDTITFYGQSLNRYEINKATGIPLYQNFAYLDADKAENVYWLAVRSDTPPIRIGTAGENPDPNLDAITIFRERFHIEQDNYFDWIDQHGQEAGTDWYWDTIANSTKTFSFNAPGHVQIENQDSKLRLWLLRGLQVVDSSVGPDRFWNHSIEVTINDELKSYLYYELKRKKKIEVINFDMQLKETNNTLDIRRIQGSGEKSNAHARLDWIELEYNRQLSFTGKGFEYFQAGISSPLKFSLSDAPETALIYDTTDPYTPKKMQAVRGNDSTFEYQITIPVNEYGRLTIWDSAQYLQASSISSKDFTNLRNPAVQANHIIISHPEFLSEAKRLSSYRNSEQSDANISSITVNVDDVYDEFSWGIYDPTALRDYLQYMWQSFESDDPFYACLVGDTTFKFKNITEDQATQNFIPTFTVARLDTTTMKIEDERTLTTDDFFGWYGERKKPYISIGRLCVTDREQARIVVDKIIDYEKTPAAGPWKNRVLLLADDNFGDQGVETNEQFVTDTEEVEEYIPLNFERDKLYLIEYEMDKNHLKPQATDDLINAINEGCLFANYSGHGNNDVITHEYIFRGSRDIERINNESRLPLFLFFSCAVGRFDRPANISLSEMLQIRNDGGAIAVISASRVTYQTSNNILNKEFLAQLFSPENPELRIGNALKQAKISLSTNPNSYRYILFGDPATRLMTPKYSITAAPVDTLMRLQKLDLSATVTDHDNPAPFTGKVYVKAQGPNIHKSYQLLSSTVEYKMPGKTIYNGEIDIDGSEFDISFVVPKDMQSDLSKPADQQKESLVLFYAEGQSEDASGVLKDFLIGDIDPDAPDDTTGPEITFKVDGTTVQDGSRIRRQPTVTLDLTDISGINVIGSRGHNIKLLIDKTNVIMLTDKFIAENGYQNGTISYDLPLLANGEHTFDITAFDTYNNIARKSVSVEVAGSETGDLAIEHLLNYPNPMTTEGTSFTFDLNDDARSASIKVYSQAGRLVDTVRFSAQYGFNQVQWNPPVVLANGVYFYKLSVVSMNGRKSSKIEKLVVMR